MLLPSINHQRRVLIASFVVLLTLGTLAEHARARRDPAFGFLEQSLNKALNLDTSQERVVVLGTFTGVLWNATSPAAVPWGAGLSVRWNHHDLGSIVMFQYYFDALFAVQPAKEYAQCFLWALQKLKAISLPTQENLYVATPNVDQWWQNFKRGAYHTMISVPFSGQTRRTQEKIDGVFTADSLAIVNITARNDWLDFGALYSFHQYNASIRWNGKNTTVDQALFADEGLLNAYISAVLIVTNSNTTYQITTPNGSSHTVTSAASYSNQPLSFAAIIRPLPATAICKPPQ